MKASDHGAAHAKGLDDQTPGSQEECTRRDPTKTRYDRNDRRGKVACRTMRIHQLGVMRRSLADVQITAKSMAGAA
jgi:hypothetical protein